MNFSIQIGRSGTKDCSRKILLLFMKSFLFLMVLGLTTLNAKESYSQTKMDIDVEQVTLQELLKEIQEKSEFIFFYEDGIFNTGEKFTVKKHNVTLPEILEPLFKERNLKFKIEDRQVVIYAEKKVKVSEKKAALQDFEISGTIVDASGVPLPGATVIEKGTNNGTQTDFDGNYSLTLTDQNATILVSFMGFATQEISVNGRPEIDIVLKEDAAALEEVVVVGYGKVKKRDLTGAVSTIKPDAIEEVPTNNALEVLQGRVSGLDMTASNGSAGADVNFTLRGNRSLSASNTPLILVDGVPYGSLRGINPSDIQSMEVLKDASATAIYGTRGANGVILITTTRGEEGRTNISVDSYYGIQSHAGLADIQNGEEFVRFKREAFRTQGITDDTQIFNPGELEAINQEQYVDWMREIIKTGVVQNYVLGINGGNDKTTFNFSAGLYDEKGLLKSDTFRGYNFSAGASHKLLDNLKIDTKFFITYNDKDIRQDPLNQANKINPFGDPYDEEGNIILYPVAGQSFNISPLADEVPGVYVNNLLEKRIFNTTFLEWDILENLNFKSSFGFDWQNNRRGYFYGTNSLTRNGNDSQSGIEHTATESYTWENTLHYSKDLGNHNLNLLLGNSLISNSNESSESYGFNQVSETTSFYDLGANANLLTIGSGLVESSLSSYFGRINYKYLDRYLLTTTFRADGSSVLAEGKKWGYFPSVALGWLISEEKFLADNEMISSLKLRASYGISGNSAISPYQTLGGLGRVTYSFDETAAFGYYPKLISNPDLTWETTATTNLGVDFSLWKNRIDGSVNVYQSKTKDLLMLRVIPATSGFSSVYENVGKTENRGLEIELSTYNITNPDDGFNWTSDFTFSKNKEEIVALTGGAQRDLGNGWIVGEPTQVFYDYEKIGIWQLGEEDEAAIYNQEPGDIRVRDQNGDGAITPEDDRVVVGTPRPDFNFGLNNEFSYRNFNLSVFLYGREGQTIRSEASGNYKIDGRENGPLVDYWTPENPTNSHPRPDMNKNQNSRFMSTLYYVDGSFLKIKNITLGYNFTGLDKYKIQNLRLYGTLRNFFTFSGLSPYDPERGGSISFPMTKQVVFGLNVNF